MIKLGPQVVIVDDQESEVTPIMSELSEMKVGYVYLNADITASDHPDKTIESVELVFLDLYYGDKFDATACAQWVLEIVPPGKPYVLIFWSKDPHLSEEVLKELEPLNLIPLRYFSLTKNDFLNNSSGDQRNSIVGEIENLLSATKVVEDVFYGKVLQKESDHVLIYCLLDEENRFFQTRRFDLGLFTGFLDVEVGEFLTITIVTEPGIRQVHFAENHMPETQKLFSEIPDHFSDLDSNHPFMKGD